MIEVEQLIVPGFVVLLGCGVYALGKWMIRRPERLEEVVWPDPKPISRRDIGATRRVGSWLVFLGPFLSFMIIALLVASLLPTRLRVNAATFPLLLVVAGFSAYRLRRAVVGSHPKSVHSQDNE